MKLTHKTEYALLALVYLARLKDGEYGLAKDIADKQQIPKRFLQQILHQLKHARYVLSARGKLGGYYLSKSPSKITLAEIVRLFDGPLAPTASASKFFYASTPIEKEKKVLAILKEIREEVAKKLENKTLADIS